jgi:hypothetical protein
MSLSIQLNISINRMPSNGTINSSPATLIFQDQRRVNIIVALTHSVN